MSQFKLIGKYGREEINGKIKRKESNNIYVVLFTLPTHEIYDLHFQLNRTVYQSQHNALDFITKHSLFDILINNPIYHNDANVQRLHTTYSMHLDPFMSTTSSGGYLNNDGLNREQIQAVNCIVEGKNYPVPYLLYGPPGKTFCSGYFFMNFTHFL